MSQVDRGARTEKLEEVAALLDKFEGKEDTVYERLKERYTTASE